MADSSITICGTLGRDPELRYTSSGRQKANMNVAVSRRWMNRNTNEWEEQTSWFTVVVWGEMAENIASTLSKGNRVIVTGRLEQRSWETEQGEKRYVVEIVADEVGPSLRWATAEVNRTERRGPGGGGGPGGGPGGGEADRPAGGGGGGGSAPAYEDFGDEEPF